MASRTLWVLVTLGSLTLAMGCAEDKKFGLMEAERKAIYLTVLQERPKVRMRVFREALNTQLAVLQVQRQAAEWELQGASTAEKINTATDKLVRIIRKTAQAEAEFITLAAGDGGGLGRSAEEWEQLVQHATEAVVGERTGLKAGEIAAIVQEGQAKGWKGLPAK